jgi:Tol biopolymer transport system component
MKGGGVDVWVYELERGVERRFTREDGMEWWAVWTPDSQRVVYHSLRDGTVNLYWKPVNGSGPEEVLVESDHQLQPFSWSADGKLFAFQELHPTNGLDIWVLPMDADGRPHPFLRTAHHEAHPTFSPDGRWLAYVSDESGRWEVYLRPYPGPGPVVQVSTEEGYEPLWSPGGREIYYRRHRGDQVMVVSFDPEEPSPRVGKPQLLFEGSYAGGVMYGRRYDLASDGKRFLMVREAEPPPPPTQYNIVLNWHQELKRLVPTDRD